MMKAIRAARLAVIVIAGIIGLAAGSAGIAVGHPAQVAAEPQAGAPMVQAPMGMMMGPGNPAMMMRPGVMPMMMMPMMGVAGPQMMGPMMMAPGGGMGPRGMMWWQGTGRDRDLSLPTIRQYFDTAIKWHGFSRLQVGKVEKKNDDIVVAEIVTKDGSLVQRYEVNRHSGVMTMVE